MSTQPNFDEHVGGPDLGDVTFPHAGLESFAPAPVGRPDVTVQIVGTGRARVLHAHGELHARGAELLLAMCEQQLREGCSHMVVDLSGVTGLDVEGVSALERVRTMFTAHGASFTVRDHERSAARRVE